MPLQQSGIEYVAKNATKFLADVRKVNRELEKQSQVGDRAAKATASTDAALGRAATSSGNASRSFGRLNTGLGSIVSRLPSLSSLIGGAGLAGALLSAANAAIEFGRTSLDSFQQFETAAAEVFTLLPELGAQGLSSLTDEIQAFSLETGRTTDTVIPALYQALSAGVPQDSVFDFLETALAASKGGVTDLETSVDALTSVLNAYNLETDEAGRVSDALFTAVRLGKTTFEELGRSIFNVTPTAAALGIEIETVSAALAALTAAGVPTTVATTQLRALLDELAKSGSRAATAFEEVSGQAFDKFIDNGGTLAEALGLLNGEAERLDTPLKNLFSSTEAGSAALLLATTGAENFAGALMEMESASGATEAAADQFAGTLAESQKSAEAASEALRLYTGERLVPLRREFNNAKVSVVEFLLEWQKTADATQANAVELFKAADSLRALGEEGASAIKVIDSAIGDAEGRTEAYAATLRLLENGFAGTAQQAAAFALAVAEANAVAGSRTGAESGPLTLDAQLAAQTADAIERIGNATEETATQTNSAAESQEDYTAALQAAQQFDAERNRIAEMTAKALRDETINREQAIAVLEDYFGNASRAENVLDNQLIALESVNGGLNTYIEQNKQAAEAAALLAASIDELRDSLSSISSGRFDDAAGIIGDLVSAENQEDVQAQIARLQENRRALVSDLISESSDLTFEQEIDLQLAFGEISLEEAELLRVEQQFFETVNSLFGADSVIELGDRAISIGSLIVQNSGAETAAQITDQIEQLVSSGQGSAVNAAIDVVPQLVASGQLGEDAVGDFVSDLLSGIENGLGVEAAVQVAIEANTTDAETAIGALQGSADELAAGEYSVDTTTNATETQAQVDAATESANALDATDPDVAISSNANSAKSEIDAVAAAINAIRTEITINIRRNITGGFSDQEFADAAAGFMQGGFTGGRVGVPAGIVHGQELVIPNNVLQRGVEASVAFMLANTPSSVLPTPATQNFSTNSSVTNVTNNNNFDNSRSLNTGDIASGQQFDRLRHEILGNDLV